MDDRYARQGHNRSPGALLDIDKLCNDLETLGLDWADKKAAAEALDDATKAVLGSCLIDAEGKTVDERNARARNAPTYQQHVTAVERARRSSYRAHILYEVQKVRVELTRTNASTERALATMR